MKKVFAKNNTITRTVHYYAVARGWKVGVFPTWDECKQQVFQFPNARYKKFGKESEALDFIKQNGETSKSQQNQPKQFKSNRKPGETSGASLTVNELGLLVKDGIPVVYTDGACSKNGTSQSKAGIGVFWGDNHDWNISAPIIGGRATNNVAEYSAIVSAIQKAVSEGLSNLIIRTDSRLIISSMNCWIKRWKQNGWKTGSGDDVKNKDLLERIDELRSQINVLFEKVDAHSGDYHNDQADKLAKEGARLYNE
ncbi:hypothetical protein ACQ4LE_006203 [Meloidogyne hapla]|uniref:Ribonuclease H1 n=1 Tax=Meloidogyne hapla TaxID=6305 RepID=A0A1I8AYD7_MELHA